MKKIVIAVLFCMLLTASAFAADVNGIWKFYGNNQTMIFFQEGNAIRVMCAYRSGGNVVTWYGEGSIAGNTLRYTLHHANINDSGDYEQVFTVSPDGKKMNGTYGRIGKVEGNWTLEKVGP